MQIIKFKIQCLPSEGVYGIVNIRVNGFPLALGYQTTGEPVALEFNSDITPFMMDEGTNYLNLEVINHQAKDLNGDGIYTYGVDDVLVVSITELSISRDGQHFRNILPIQFAQPNGDSVTITSLDVCTTVNQPFSGFCPGDILNQL
jgi:hypothetical protein